MEASRSREDTERRLRNTLVGPVAAVAVASIALAIGAGQARGDGPWSVVLHDNHHSARASAFPDPSRLPATPDWSAPPGYATPLIVGSTIYAQRSQHGHGDDTTLFAAFDLETGTVLWERSQDLVFPSALAWHGGRLVYVAFEFPNLDGFLFVRDADDGGLLYQEPVPNAVVALPTVHEDAETGEVTAFLAAPAFTNFGTGPSMTAVTLGTDSATVKWTDPVPRDFGLASFPTVVDDRVVVTGPGHYFAYDMEDGDALEFHSAGIYGGGGGTAAWDPLRRRLYIVEMMGPEPVDLVSAWDVGMDGSIELAWTFGAGRWMSANGVAIDDDGVVWTSDYNHLLALDPDDGALLASIEGDFGAGLTPVAAGDTVWTFGHDSADGTVGYDRRSLEMVRWLPGARGDLNNPFGEPCALAPRALVLERERLYGAWGFDVFLARRPCGDPAGEEGTVRAVDALQTLRAAVGAADCERCVCDVDDSGSVAAADALRVLRRAVGLDVELSCPACG